MGVLDKIMGKLRSEQQATAAQEKINKDAQDFWASLGAEEQAAVLSAAGAVIPDGSSNDSPPQDEEQDETTETVETEPEPAPQPAPKVETDSKVTIRPPSNPNPKGGLTIANIERGLVDPNVFSKAIEDGTVERMIEAHYKV